MSLLPPPLPEAFYSRDVCEVARDLLGKTLIRACRDGTAAGVIVEVEAYRGSTDPASHAFRGPTPRNASMFGPAGRAYVYTIHTRFCLNVVAESKHSACGILIRAMEPLVGLPLMSRRRNTDKRVDLTRGPGRLCEALRIDRKLDGWRLTRPRRLWIGPRLDEVPSDLPMGVSPRIGVSRAQDALLRFFVDGNRFVSGRRDVHRGTLAELLDERARGRYASVVRR